MNEEFRQGIRFTWKTVVLFVNYVNFCALVLFAVCIDGYRSV